MQKGHLPFILTIALLLCVGLSSCKKESTLGIDNNRVVKIPYSLFAGDTSGAIVTTTDGDHIYNVFPSDGYPPQLLLSSGDNLLMVKDNLFLSANSGKNFNPVYLHIHKFPWQTMAYNYPAHNRIYVTSTEGNGIAYSDDHGLHWKVDNLWVAATSLPPTFEISSFSGLANGMLFAYSNIGNILFVKDGVDGIWTPVTTEGSFPVNPSGYYLTSNETTLFLVDRNGIGGVWHSEDAGIHWTKFNRGALPMTTQYLSALSPNGGTSLLVGTDTVGVYMVQNGSFIEVSGGLETRTSVYSLASKKNIYKNDNVKQYIYAGTSTGLYRSEDLGRTWYSITSGVWKRKYVAIY